MQLKSLHQKMTLHGALLFMLLCVVGMTKSYAEDFDFLAVCSTGQTLYYRITNNDTHEVQLTYPNHYSYQPSPTVYYYYYWYNYTKPTGNIIIPYYVEHNGINYSVTSIRDHTFGDRFTKYSIHI